MVLYAHGIAKISAGLLLALDSQPLRGGPFNAPGWPGLKLQIAAEPGLNSETVAYEQISNGMEGCQDSPCIHRKQQQRLIQSNQAAESSYRGLRGGIRSISSCITVSTRSIPRAVGARVAAIATAMQLLQL
jgi:hypothetical protein